MTLVRRTSPQGEFVSFRQATARLVARAGLPAGETTTETARAGT
jgi:hypothetical protein